MTIKITVAELSVAEDTTMTDIVIMHSDIWVYNESTLTLGEGARIDTCRVYAPRKPTSTKPAIFIDGGAMVGSRLDTTLPKHLLERETE